jgi:hypothetical protein
MTVKSDFENLIKDMKWDDDPNFNETPARVTLKKNVIPNRSKT